MKRFFTLFCIVLLILTCFNACGEPDAEEIDWINIRLGEVLPEPQSNLMEVVSNSKDHLDVYVYNITRNNYYEYVRWCEEQHGFDIAVSTIGDSFGAYNWQGYDLSLCYDDDEQSMRIDLDAPDELGEFTIPDYATDAGLPQPTSQLGHFRIKNSDRFILTVGYNSREEYDSYVEACIAAGFIIDAEKNESAYSAFNENGFKVSLDCEEYGIYTVVFNCPEIVEPDNTDPTENELTEQPTSPSNPGENVVNITINCDENLFFSRYNLDIYLNGSQKAELQHGKSGTYKYNLVDGTYKLTLRNANDSSVTGEIQFTITDSTDITYKVHCFSDEVSIKQERFEIMRPLEANESKVPDDSKNYKGKQYKNVISELKFAGFTNIKTEILYDIVFGWTEEGEVDSVSIGGNKSFAKGDIFDKDIEIVVTYHMLEEDDPTRIRMPKGATAYEGKHYSEVKSALEELGFTNIVLEKMETTDAYYEDGEVYRITIGYDHFEAGETFKPTDKVLIKYYSVQIPEKIPNITIENNDDLAALMSITDQTDIATIQKYVKKLKGKVIEFDGYIVFVMQHGNYKTRFDVCIVNGDGVGRVYGPLFGFEDVNFYEMNVSGTDTVSEGMLFKIEAEIVGYNNEGNYVILEPVSMTIRRGEQEENAERPNMTKLILPPENSKLGRDFDSESKSTIYYINVDGLHNTPTIATWGTATVTDGVAEYLDYLKELGFTVTITDYTHKEPYAGFNMYETNFAVSNTNISWTMYLCVQQEIFVEYELDVHK